MGRIDLTVADFSTLFEASPAAMALSRLADGVFVDANEAFLRLHGYARDEIVGHVGAELELWERPQERERIVALIRSEGRAQNFVHAYRCKSGRVGRALVSLNIVDVESQPHMLGVLNDLAELDSMEANLTATEARLRSIFEHTDAGIAFADGAGTALSFNTAFQNLLGYPEARLRGMNFAEFTHPEDLPRELPLLEDVMQGRKDHYRLEKRLVAADGSVKWIEGFVSAIRDAHGDVMNFIGITTDITARRQADAMLNLYAKVLQHNGEGILISDAKNRIVAVNAAFRRLTGYEEGDVLGKDPSILASGDTPRETYAAMWDALGAAGYWQGELMERRKDGSVYPKWIAISVLHDAAGNLTNYIASFTDISERKTAEEQIRQLAYYDPLTDLPNRRLLLDRLGQAVSQAQRHDRLLAVMFMDLDNFKQINDTLGHEAGDELLKQVAMRLQACVRTGDTVSRQGGDEFVIVLAEIANPAAAVVVADKILHALASPVALGAAAPVVTISIGISVYSADGADNAAELMRQADIAMYEAKRAGRNRYHFFTATQFGGR
ncbi:MAG: PAS domain S-box protein [Rhodocyclaceae bacterium]|nr:PAS domain S-box protein [Rhodocyclaceae bacterium]